MRVAGVVEVEGVAGADGCGGAGGPPGVLQAVTVRIDSAAATVRRRRTPRCTAPVMPTSCHRAASHHLKWVTHGAVPGATLGA